MSRRVLYFPLELTKSPVARFFYATLDKTAVLWIVGLFYVYPVVTVYLTLVPLDFHVCVCGIWGPDPLLWRAYETLNSHHTLIFWMLGAVWLGLWRSGMKPLVGIFGIWLTIAAHEMTWWAIDAAFGFMPNPLWLLMGWLFAPCVITLTFYITLVGIPDWRFLAVVAGTYAVWAFLGFHVTVNWIPGGTQYYADPWTNLTEIASWVCIVVGFVVFERPHLADWSKTVERLVNQV